MKTEKELIRVIRVADRYKLINLDELKKSVDKETERRLQETIKKAKDLIFNNKTNVR